MQLCLELVNDIHADLARKNSHPFIRILRQFNELIRLKTSDEDAEFILENALKIADMMRKKAKFSECHLLLKWVSESLEHIGEAKRKLNVIKRCSRRTWSVVISMKRKRGNYKSEVLNDIIPTLKSLLKLLEKTWTSDVKEVGEAESWCFYYIATCYQYVNKYSIVYEYSQNAISLMKDTFGSEYRKYRVVGLSHAITGEAWKSMKSYEYAIEQYEKASQVFEIAEDINSDMYRKSCINHEKSKIVGLRQSLFFVSMSKKRSKKSKNLDLSDEIENGEKTVSASGQGKLSYRQTLT